MLEFNGDITDFFFQEIKKKGKYTLEKIGSKIVIIPREEEPYYKPIIQINDIERLKIELQKDKKEMEEKAKNLQASIGSDSELM